MTIGDDAGTTAKGDSAHTGTAMKISSKAKTPRPQRFLEVMDLLLNGCRFSFVAVVPAGDRMYRQRVRLSGGERSCQLLGTMQRRCPRRFLLTNSYKSCILLNCIYVV